jgi:hypothetical protein
MAKASRILLIDDDLEYCTTLRRTISTNKKNVVIDYARTLEEGKEALASRNSRYSGIIIDINGLIDRTSESTNRKHLRLAIQTCEELAPGIPTVISTAETQERKEEIETIKEMYEGQYPVFLKDYDHQIEMIDWVKGREEDLPNFKIRNRHKNVFEIFEKNYLGPDAESCFYQVMEHAEDKQVELASNKATFKSQLNNARNVLEAILRKIGETDPNFLPPERLYKTIEDKRSGRMRPTYDQVNFSGALWFISEQFGRAHPVSHFGFTVFDIASSMGTHAIRSKHGYKVSKYTFTAVAYALADFLLWFKTFMETRGGKQENDNR